jgi:hypothetical protein
VNPGQRAGHVRDRHRQRSRRADAKPAVAKPAELPDRGGWVAAYRIVTQVEHVDAGHSPESQIRADPVAAARAPDASASGPQIAVAWSRR